MPYTTRYLYLCVDEDGLECAFADARPKRSEKIGKDTRYWYSIFANPVVLPKGSIRAITGCVLSWKDRPIKWKP